MSGVDAGDVSTMAVSLLAVVGLIVAAGYVLRRTPLGAVTRQSGPLRVVATLPLGARERLVLVEARGTELLLAISPAGVVNVSAAHSAETSAVAATAGTALSRDAAGHGTRARGLAAPAGGAERQG